MTSRTTAGPVRNMFAALGHDDEVGQRGRVGAAAGRRAADHGDLRDLAATARRARGRSARSRPSAADALLHARAAGLDEADDGRAGAAGEPQHAHDRVGVLLAERAAEVATGPARSRTPGGRRRGRRRRSRRRRGGPSRPCGASARPSAAASASRGSQSASRRSSGESRSIAASRIDLRRVMRPPGRGRRCGRRSRTRSTARRRAGRRCRACGPRSGRSRGRAPRRAPRSPSVGGAIAVAQRQQRRDRLDGAGGAEQVADRRLRRGDRDRRALARRAPP